MKRLLMLLAGIVVLFSVDAAHATVIEAFRIQQSIDVSGIGAHAGYELDFLIDNPVLLGDCRYHELTRLEGNGTQYLIDILQRTLKYEEEDKIGDMPFPEAIAWYEADLLLGQVMITGTDNFTMVSWGLQGIPDLSRYHIDSLYAMDCTSLSTDMADFDIRILAEVTSVPEPSSLLLLALGAAGICFAKRMRVGTR